MPSAQHSLHSSDPRYRKVIEWANDRDLFKREALYIRPKTGGVIRYVERGIQTQTNSIIRNKKRVRVLKARQLGITTGALADLFHTFLFVPYTKIAFAAHHGSTATEIFDIVSTFYDLLPKWFKRLPLFKTKKDNANSLSLKNGSTIKVGTANSEFWRGQTYQHAHLTECAFYDDLKKVFASITMAVSDTGTIAFETTANGHNEFYRQWISSDSGYEHIFYSWVEDPEYVCDVMPDNITEVEQSYIDLWELPPERAAWFVKTFREKCASDMNLFNQEMPIAPEVAFIATGAKYFTKLFPLINRDELKDGIEVFEQPATNRVYVIGADPASGAPTGDKSAAVVMDATNKHRPRIVATFNARLPVPDFAQVLILLAKRYNNALINPELNNHGLTLITELRRQKYSKLLRESSFNGKTVHWANQYGTLITNSSRNKLLSSLNREISSNILAIPCTRLQQQINVFAYNKRLRPEALPGENDDLVFAAAHALYAVGYAHLPSTTEDEPPLYSMVEKLEWEMRHGRLYDRPLVTAADILDGDSTY